MKPSTKTRLIPIPAVCALAVGFGGTSQQRHAIDVAEPPMCAQIANGGGRVMGVAPHLYGVGFSPDLTFHTGEPVAQFSSVGPLSMRYNNLSDANDDSVAAHEIASRCTEVLGIRVGVDDVRQTAQKIMGDEVK